MKTLKTQIPILLLLLSSIFICANCEREKKTVTYCFTSDDQSKLLPHYTNGKIFTFVNSYGDERKFEVVEVEQEIIQDYSPGGMGGWERYYYYFEMKKIMLKDYRNEKKYIFKIFRYPIDYLSAQTKSYKKFPSRLILEISSNDSEYAGYGSLQTSFNYDDPTTTLSSNGLTYKKIHILDRDLKSYMGLSPDHWEHLGGMFNEAKYTYYDEDYGIAGFDSYDGQQWRLKIGNKH